MIKKKIILYKKYIKKTAMYISKKSFKIYLKITYNKIKIFIYNFFYLQIKNS